MTFTPGQPANPYRRLPEKKAEGPRRVRGGIKLRTKEGPIARHAIAQQFLQLIEAKLDTTCMAAGLDYARAGQVLELTFVPSALESRVQGTAAKPYVTRLQFPTLNESQWRTLIDAMAGEAAYAAKLLAGELPASVLELAASRGLPLLPDAHESIAVDCNCGARNGCKHAAAVAYLAAERLSDESPLILTLCGMQPEHVLERLRQARTMQTSGSTAAQPDPMIPETQFPPPPLEACLDEFWRGSPEHLIEMHRRAPAHHSPHALLRRLGPSPLNGRFPLAGLLASVYDEVAAAARKLRDGNGNGEQ